MLVIGGAVVAASVLMMVDALLWSVGENGRSEPASRQREAAQEFGRLAVRGVLLVGFPLTVGGLFAPTSAAMAWLVVGVTAVLGLWCCRRLVSRYPWLELDRERWARDAQIGGGGRRRTIAILGVALVVSVAAMCIAMLGLVSPR